jgi:hypothetical protein
MRLVITALVTLTIFAGQAYAGALDAFLGGFKLEITRPDQSAPKHLTCYPNGNYRELLRGVTSRQQIVRLSFDQIDLNWKSKFDCDVQPIPEGRRYQFHEFVVTDRFIIPVGQVRTTRWFITPLDVFPRNEWELWRDRRTGLDWVRPKDNRCSATRSLIGWLNPDYIWIPDRCRPRQTGPARTRPRF